MGLGDLSPEGTESSGGSQQTYVTFKNPSNDEVELDDNNAHRHEQEYFDAIQQLRDIMGRDINVAIGRFAHAAVQAEKNNDNQPLEELFEDISA